MAGKIDGLGIVGRDPGRAEGEHDVEQDDEQADEAERLGLDELPKRIGPLGQRIDRGDGALRSVAMVQALSSSRMRGSSQP